MNFSIFLDNGYKKVVMEILMIILIVIGAISEYAIKVNDWYNETGKEQIMLFIQSSLKFINNKTGVIDTITNKIIDGIDQLNKFVHE
jgi:hypothetical protein